MTFPTTLPPPTHEPLRGGPVLRWGIIGPGRIARDWARAVLAHTDQRIVAVGSNTPGRAEAFARGFGIERVHGSHRALLEDPEVDAVYVATVNSGHVADALAAIEAGTPVLVEKPLATSAAEALRIVHAAREAGVFVQEAMWTRFLPQTTVVDRLLADGALGGVAGASADFGGVVPFDPASRLFDPDAGGGVLLDIGVYCVWWDLFAVGDPASPDLLPAIHAVGACAPSGVDDDAALTWTHRGARGPAGAVSRAWATWRAPLEARAMVAGSEGRIDVAAPFCAPAGFTLTSTDERTRLSFEDPSGLRWREGLAYQVTAMAADVAAGRTESSRHPWGMSLMTLDVLDRARSALAAAMPERP